MSSSVEMQAFHYIPDPLPQQVRALDRTVDSVVRDRRLSVAEATGYFETVERLKSFVHTHQDDVKMQVFGAVLSGCALKDGVVNVCVSGNGPVALTLVQVYRILKKYGGPQYVNVEGDFSGRGSVKVEEAESGRQLTLVINCDTDVLASQLLQIYFSADQRAMKLAVMLRCWAQICRLDRPEDGTLPAYAFDILVIYFLQQVGPPVLPVLPLPQNAGKCRLHPDIMHRLKSQADAWTSDNASSVGELWLQLLKFYCCHFDSVSSVVCVRRRMLLTGREKGWKDRNLSIEDPVCVEQNMARTMQSPVVVSLFWTNWGKAYDYFAMPRNSTGKPLICPSRFNWTSGSVKRPQQQQQQEVMTIGAEVNKADPEREEAATTPCLEPAAAFLAAKSADAAVAAAVDGGVDGDGGDGVNEAEKQSGVLEATGPEDVREGGGDAQGAEEQNVFSYDLYCDLFTKGETPRPKWCRLCGKSGHTKKKCEEMARPVISVPNTTTPDHVKLVDKVITKILSDFSPMEADIEDRSQFIEKLTGYVRTVYPDACVGVYGSTVSGFSFFSSDLDISISFKETSRKGGGPPRSLERVARILRGTREFNHIQVIEMARVPIIKFRHTHTQLEGDISFCNSLGMYNTRLLRCYSSIDERVKLLGLAVKVLAKVCNIGEASMGSLSSYSYILMMLHYLQQCSPPLIPILQEIYPEGGKPETHEFLIDGCNVWFFDDVERLSEVWPGQGQNTQSVGALWMGFLRYYSTQFDWNGSVVSIRQTDMLTKFEKGWTSKSLAIEDPFLLNRNLGGHLSNWGDACIAHTFQCGAAHFWKPVGRVLADLSEYFFDVHMLTGGHDKAAYYCPACSEFGHVFMECPDRAFQKNFSGSSRLMGCHILNYLRETHQTQKAEVIAEPEVNAEVIAEPELNAEVKVSPVLISGTKNKRKIRKKRRRAEKVQLEKAGKGQPEKARKGQPEKAGKGQPEKAEKSSTSNTAACTDPASGTSRVGKTEMPDRGTHRSENTGAPISGKNRAESGKKAIPQEGLSQTKNTGPQVSGKDRSEKGEPGQKEIPQEGQWKQQQRKTGPGCPPVQEKLVENQQPTARDHRAERGRQATPSAMEPVGQQSSDWLRLFCLPANEDHSPVVTDHSDDRDDHSPVVRIHSVDTNDSNDPLPEVTIHSINTIDSGDPLPEVTIHSKDSDAHSPEVTIHSVNTIDSGDPLPEVTIHSKVSDAHSPEVTIHSEDTIDSDDPLPEVTIHSKDSDDHSPEVTIHSEDTIDSDDCSPVPTIHSNDSDDRSPVPTIHSNDSDDRSPVPTIHSNDSDDRSPVPTHHPISLDSRPVMAVSPVQQCPTPWDQADRTVSRPVQSSVEAQARETSQLSACDAEHSDAGSDSQSGTDRSDTGADSQSGTEHSDTGADSQSGTERSDTGADSQSGTEHSDTGADSQSGTEHSDTGADSQSGTEHSDTGADSQSSSLGHEMLRIQFQQQELIQQQLQLIRQQQAVEQQLLQQQLAASRTMSSRVVSRQPPPTAAPHKNSKKSGSGTKENQTLE